MLEEQQVMEDKGRTTPAIMMGAEQDKWNKRTGEIVSFEIPTQAQQCAIVPIK